MKRRKLNRRRSALRWLAAFLVLVAFVCIADLYCITPEQSLRKMADEYDLGELQLLMTAEDEAVPYGYNRAYIVQNQGLSGLCFGGWNWRTGWVCSFLQVMEHGSSSSVPVDFVYIRGEEETGWEYEKLNSYAKPYIMGIILDPNVETVEVSLGKRVDANEERVWEERDRVSLGREEWISGPYYSCFFYSFEPCKTGYWPEIRALDKNGNPITWTKLNGEPVEWYGIGWEDEFYPDYWNHSNGQRH